jgi:outer membrane protein
VSQSQILLVRAEDELKIARQKLSLLTRLPESSQYADPALFPEEVTELEELQKRALENREDLKSARSNARVAKEFVTITKGGHYPQVYAEGGVHYQDSDPRTGLDATTYYGGIRVQIPLFEGGLMRYEVAEARSKMRQAEYASELLKRSIASEVQEAFINHRTLTAVLLTANEQYKYARSNFDTIEELFVDGLVPSLSLIDAQQALFVAEHQLINARYQQQLSIIRLQQSQGVLGRSPETARQDS